MSRLLRGFKNRGKKYFLNRYSKVNEEPIIILGNQKSGTTAIAKLLSHATGYSVTSDIPKIKYPVQTMLYNNEISFEKFVNKNKHDFSKRIVKEPWLTFLYNDVKEFFPKAKYVFIVRRPEANIRSILNRVSQPGNLNGLDNIKKEIREQISIDWEKIVDINTLGISSDHYIDSLSKRWVMAAQTYLMHKDNMILVRYEDFNNDKVGEINRLAHKLSLDVQHDISPMVDKPLQRQGNSKTNLLEFFGEDNLTIIDTICKETEKQIYV